MFSNLYAIGLHTALPPYSYNKTELVGGDSGDSFDDVLSGSEQPSKITNMIIDYKISGGPGIDFDYVVNGIQVTYPVEQHQP